MAGAEQNVDMVIDPTDEIDFFLWVSHGSNVSDDTEYFYFPFEYKFNYLVMYSKPLKPTSDAELDAIIANPCDMVTGTCPILPIQKINGKKKIYLPPLLFNLNEVEVPSVEEKIGLWHYRIKKLGHNVCETVDRAVQVCNYRYIRKKYGYKYITYSSIFSEVEIYCKDVDIPRDTVLLGIFSCQSSNYKYINRPATRDKISRFIPRIKERNIQIEFETAVNPNNNYLPLMIPYNDGLKPWEPLGGITRQGCGLNVLAYYDLMPENEARQETTCLYKGTSIFKIIQYIADGLLKKNISINSVLVLHYNLYKYGIAVILYILDMPTYTNYAIIFKIYESSDNHAGHTISILKMKDSKEYYLIDPQLRLTLPFKNVFNLYDIMKANYSDKHYIDIIYRNTNNSEKTNFNILEMHSKLSIDNNYSILPYDEDIIFGGKKNRVKGKNSVKRKSRVKGKKQVKGRGLTGGIYSNKTIKRTKKEENKEEEEKIKNIQKILKQTDSKNNIKTALIVDSTVINKDDDMIFSNETPNL